MFAICTVDSLMNNRWLLSLFEDYISWQFLASALVIVKEAVLNCTSWQRCQLHNWHSRQRSPRNSPRSR